MIRTGIYDENKDVQSVDQVGWIDLGEALENGYIPGSIEGDDLVYNDIEDPQSVMHTASDTFELYRQADYVKSYKPSGANSESDAASEG